MLPLVLIIPVLVILSCASWEWTASAADFVEQQRRETLRGLTGVSVWVGVPSEMMSEGLIDMHIKTDVEVRLRRARVRVLEVSSRDSATLAITVGGLKSRPSP